MTPDWLDEILVDTMLNRPNSEWNDKIREIYYKRRAADPRVVEAKARIIEHIGKPLTMESLRSQIRTMTKKSDLYKLLKTELSTLGWWKNRPRGKADVSHFMKNQ